MDQIKYNTWKNPKSSMDRKQRKFRYKKIRAWGTVLALKREICSQGRERKRGNRGRPNGGLDKIF